MLSTATLDCHVEEDSSEEDDKVAEGDTAAEVASALTVEDVSKEGAEVAIDWTRFVEDSTTGVATGCVED